MGIAHIVKMVFCEKNCTTLDLQTFQKKDRKSTFVHFSILLDVEGERA